MSSTLHVSFARTLAFGSFLLSGACAHGETADASLPVGQPRTAAEATAKSPRYPVSHGLLLSSARLRQKCNLAEPPADSAQTDFNGNLLRVQGMEALDRVAKCMLSGALQGSTVTVTSHGDDRHTGPYNRQLGTLRAQTVRDYLVGRGVVETRIALVALGARSPAEEGSKAPRGRNVELDEATLATP